MDDEIPAADDAIVTRAGPAETAAFVLTNRVPRWALTHCVGRLAAIESPAFTRLAMRVWSWFTPIELRDCPPARYRSLRECFIRPLRPGARPIDPDPAALCSPVDAIVVAHGTVRDGLLLQVKGLTYRLHELLGVPPDDALCARLDGGRYVAMRLTAGMYHRIHAPHDLCIEHVRLIRGDVWNVHPPALRRVPGLYCRNERATIRARLTGAVDGDEIVIVPVAAILVASLRLHGIDPQRHLRTLGRTDWPVALHVRKGDELGWFEQGSTVLLFAPRAFVPTPAVAAGRRVQMGEALLRRAS